MNNLRSLWFLDIKMKRLLRCFLVSLAFIFSSNSLYAQNLFYYPPGKFSFVLPSGWEKIPEDVVNKYLTEFQNQFKVKRPNYDLCFNRKGATLPFEYPYFVIIIYRDYKTKKDILNSLSTLQSTFQKQVDSLNKGKIKGLLGDAFISQPNYDPQKNIITYSMRSNDQTVTISSIIFCRYGSIAVNFYSEDPSYLPIFKDIIESFKFDEGYEYK